MARAIAKSLGKPEIALSIYDGVVMTDPEEQFRHKVTHDLVEQIISGLCGTDQPVENANLAVPTEVPFAHRKTVFKGTLEQVQEHFLEKLWTDGLPIIPPTTDRVEAFLRFTDRSPDEVIGVLKPEGREATVWNVAVNGVIAGCRPEYMPILLAAVEAISQPQFRIQDAGSTPGWEPLVTVSGPIARELDFNCGQGVMRVGRQPNSSVGRFLRLYMRNVPGLRIPPGSTDKGTISYTFNVALAENEEAVRAINWPTFGQDRGFRHDENVVTVRSVVAVSTPIYVAGETAADMVRTIVDVWGKGDCAYWTSGGMIYGTFFPLLVISPAIARAIARHGWTKDDIRSYLFEHSLVPAELVERLTRQVGISDFSIARLAEQGVVAKECVGGLVPVFRRAEWIDIVVAGDPDRNQVRGYVNNHVQGVPTSRRVELPVQWARLRSRLREA